MDSEHAWPSPGAALPEAGDEQAGERLMNEATVAVMKDTRRRPRFRKPHIFKTD